MPPPPCENMILSPTCSPERGEGRWQGRGARGGERVQWLEVSEYTKHLYCTRTRRPQAPARGPPRRSSGGLCSSGGGSCQLLKRRKVVPLLLTHYSPLQRRITVVVRQEEEDTSTRPHFTSTLILKFLWGEKGTPRVFAPDDAPKFFL
jgi:hypothetical protein